MTDKPSEAKTEVCLFKQKTRLARIRAAKIRGTNAYMRYKQNGLLIDSLEEVTGTKWRLGEGWEGRLTGCRGSSVTLACRSATREGGHATTHRGSGRGRRAGVWGVHAVTQSLLSILVLQCDRPLSLTSHLSAAALTCSVNTSSLSVHTAGGPGRHTFCLLVAPSHYKSL